MTTNSKARVSLTFDTGDVIDTWTSCEFRDNFTDPIGSLTLKVAPLAKNWNVQAGLLAKGNQVRLYINDALQGRFIIQTAERDYSATSGRTITIKCHTPLVTPHEGAVDPDLSLQNLSDVSIANVMLQVLGPYGFDVVSTDARANINALTGKPLAGGEAPLYAVGDLKMKDAIAHAGETAIQFIMRVISRLGVTIRIAFDDTILIAAPNYNQDEAYTVALTLTPGQGAYKGAYATGFTDADRFFGSVKVTETNAGQFSEADITGMRKFQPGDPNVARPHAQVLSGSILPYRCQYRSTPAPFKPMSYKDKSSRDANQATNAAMWELGYRAKEAYVVEGTVQGWISATGRVWTVDTMARVVVEPEGLDDPMYLLERTLHMDAQGGQYASLKFIPLGALVLGQNPAGHH